MRRRRLYLKMQEKLTGIALGAVKHSDRHDIATLYTLERGRVAVAVAAGGGRRRRTPLMPLSVVELNVSGRGGSEVMRASGIAPLEVWRTLYVDAAKMAVVMFMAEFIGKLTRDSGPDRPMWTYVAESVRLLDATASAAGVANFPIAFLASLTPFAGIAPDARGYAPGRIFDMRAGTYTDTHARAGGDLLGGPAAEAVRMLSRITFANAGRFRFSREERRQTLEGLLRYYSIHLPGLGGLKSPAVLTEVLG